ncbi:hypothetical protein EVA_07628 [gut metagenome]|uniref:Uncharacterized protein n=1 Tax=gut metagenome TaxID=749906 RepID=J9GBP3_9ZZZZ
MRVQPAASSDSSKKPEAIPNARGSPLHSDGRQTGGATL